MFHVRHRRRARIASFGIVPVLLLAGGIPLSAQIGFESLLNNVTDISVSLSCWSTRSHFLREEDCPNTRFGYGVEVIWNLHSIPIGRDRRGDPDTTWVLSEKRESYRGTQVDSTRAYSVKLVPAKDRRATVLLEMGLGYSQFLGVASSDPAFELRGAVREIPAIALYGTLNMRGRVSQWIKPYVGIRSGLIQLHNVQLFAPIPGDSVIPYTGSAQAFQIGGAGGLAIGRNPFHLLGELAYNVRRFPSVQWTAPSINRIPDYFPRAFDFSGITGSLGVQVTIRTPD